MIISERIFMLLEERGISQKEFSEKTGISQSTISDWKRKKTNPASDKIMIICDVLKVTPYQLLSGAENEKYTELNYVVVDKASGEYSFLEAFRNADQKEKSRIIGYMEALLEKQLDTAYDTMYNKGRRE